MTDALYCPLRHGLWPYDASDEEKQPETNLGLFWIAGEKSGLAGQLGDFGSEVVFALLDAFALVIAVEAGDGDLAAQSLGGLFNILADGDAVVLDIEHLQQAVVLVVLAKLAGDDAFQHLLGLVGHLGILCHLLLQDLLLLVQNGSGDGGSVKVRHIVGRDLQGNILGEFGKFGLVGDIGIKLDDNAGHTGAVHIGADGAFHDDKAAQGKLFADGVGLLLQDLLNGLFGAVELAGLEGVHISGVAGKDGAEHEELAMDIANSGVTIAGLIPWCIACAVPLSMLGVGVEALPYACLLYLIPLCYLFTKRFFFPAKSKGSETPV